MKDKIWRCDLKSPCVKYCESKNNKHQCGIYKRNKMKLEEEIYHLMDLLVINTNNTVKCLIMNDEQKQESISYDTDLITKLQKMLDED